MANIKYKTDEERKAARAREQKAAKLRYETRRREKRQEAAGILPMWKAAAAIDAMKKEGATFSEAWLVLNEVLDERGLRLSVNCL